MNYNKFTDWQEVVNENKDYQSGGSSKKQWLNIKTGERTDEHPGVKLFKINRKNMRKRAVEKFDKDFIQAIDNE